MTRDQLEHAIRAVCDVAARKRIRELEAAVADEHIDHGLEKASFHVACERMGVDPDDLKKGRYDAVRTAQELPEGSAMIISGLCKGAGMSRQNFCKARTSRKRKSVDERPSFAAGTRRSAFSMAAADPCAGRAGVAAGVGGGKTAGRAGAVSTLAAARKGRS
jgi:hypothetical protein